MMHSIVFLHSNARYRFILRILHVHIFSDKDKKNMKPCIVLFLKPMQ